MQDVVLISEIAGLGLSARGRERFRRAALARLQCALPFDWAVLHTAPRQMEEGRPTLHGLDPLSGGRILERWKAALDPVLPAGAEVRSLAGADASALSESLAGRGRFACGALVLPLGPSERPTSVLVLVRVERAFGERERELAVLLAPVLALADEHTLEAPEATGTRLSPRESEILDYLCRGFRNEDIARALGTSRNTVRNQLGRLYRKTGVCTRSELVGLLTPTVRRAAH